MRRSCRVILLAVLLIGSLVIIAPDRSEATDIYEWTSHTPDMDSYVRRDYPLTNYGTGGSLEMSSDDRQLFFCWNLTGITAGATIDGAFLWLYNVDDFSHAPQPTYSYILWSDNNWTEGGITWNNRPRSDNSLHYIADLEENYTDHEWAIGGDYGGALTSTVQSAFDGSGRLDLCLNYSSATTHTRQYTSAENPLTEFRPRLWIYWHIAGPMVYYWTYAIYPIADATVSGEEPSTCFGLEPTLTLRDYPEEKEVYMRWDLSLVPADSTIVDAQLWLYKESDGVPGGSLSVAYHYLYYNFDPEWNESTFSWFDRPREGALPICTMDDGSSKVGWTHASGNALTDRVKTQFEAVNQAHLCLLADFDNADGQRIYTSEEGSHDLKPYLLVTFYSPTHQYPQPDAPGEPTAWPDLSMWIVSVFGIVGFAGMIAVPVVMVYWAKHGDGYLQSFIHAAIFWAICFGLFCTSVVW